MIAGPEQTLEQMAPHPGGAGEARGLGSEGEAGCLAQQAGVKFNYKAAPDHFAWICYLLCEGE